MVCLRSGLRPSLRHTTRTVPQFSHEHWYRNWEGAKLRRGDFPHRDAALALIADLPLIDLDEAVAEIVDAYIAHHVMPNDPQGDALHLAAASFHRCDFLVTWNCRHLANANKFGHIRRVNGILGIGIPVLVTPLELLQEESADE